MAQEYTINKFDGGISGDDYLGASGSYLDSENLDFREQHNGIQLSRVLQEKSAALTEDVHGIIEVKDPSGTTRKQFAFGGDGTFWGATSGSSGVALGVTGDAADLLSGVAFGTDFLFTTEVTGVLEIVRVLKTDAYSSCATLNGFVGKIDDDYISGITSSSTSGAYPMLNFADETLYIGSGKKLYTVAALATAAAQIFDDLEDEIVGLTQYSGLFKIYLANGKINFWDGVSSTFNAITDIEVPIREVHSHGGVDYILAGISSFYSELHILQGYETQLLQRVVYSDEEDKQLFRLGGAGTTWRQQSMSQILGLLYIVSNGGTNDGIWTYGKKMLGINDSFNFPNLIDDQGHAISSIFAVKETSVGLMVGYNANSENKLGLINIATIAAIGDFSTAGKYVSRRFDGGNRTQEKQISKIRVKTKGISSTETLVLKITRDEESQDTIGTMNTAGTDYYEFFAPVGTFYDLKIQVDFAGDGTATPKLEEINIIYEIVND